MRESRFTDCQIVEVLKQADGGTAVPGLCHGHGISSATVYKWRAKFGDMVVSMMAGMKELVDKNQRLKKTYVDEKLKAEILQEAISTKW